MVHVVQEHDTCHTTRSMTRATRPQDSKQRIQHPLNAFAEFSKFHIEAPVFKLDVQAAIDAVESKKVRACSSARSCAGAGRMGWRTADAVQEYYRNAPPPETAAEKAEKAEKKKAEKESAKAEKAAEKADAPEPKEKSSKAKGERNKTASADGEAEARANEATVEVKVFLPLFHDAPA